MTYAMRNLHRRAESWRSLTLRVKPDKDPRGTRVLDSDGTNQQPARAWRRPGARAVRRAPPMRLKGRTALVTGGSRGIGRAIALALGEEGADVAINYVSSEKSARDVAET